MRGKRVSRTDGLGREELHDDLAVVAQDILVGQVEAEARAALAGHLGRVAGGLSEGIRVTLGVLAAEFVR